MVNWNPGKEDCSPLLQQKNIMIEVGCGIVVFLIIFILTGTYIYRKRWSIKLYLRLRQSKHQYKRLNYQEFDFDAFVAYHSNDRDWLIKYLMPHLESNLKLRLCVHERDFLPGNFIIDSIVENISQSRKIILILSNDFARSEWCQFEASQAYTRITTRDVTDVLVIRIEEVPHRHLTNTMISILETLVYIDWTNTDIGRKTFWRRIDESLKDVD